jgi:hypothetical protein
VGDSFVIWCVLHLHTHTHTYIYIYICSCLVSKYVLPDGFFISFSFLALAHPALSKVWRDHVLRAHHLSNRHSFGPKPSAAVLTLIQTNEKSKSSCPFIFGSGVVMCLRFFLLLLAGIATMKINKSKLKNMVEKGAPVVLASLKRKKVDEGQSSILPEQSGPSSKKASVVQMPLLVPQPHPVVQISD